MMTPAMFALYVSLLCNALNGQSDDLLSPTLTAFILHILVYGFNLLFNEIMPSYVVLTSNTFGTRI